MPDINWEDHDDVSEPSSSKKPFTQKSSSQSHALQRPKQDLPHLGIAERYAHQPQFTGPRQRKNPLNSAQNRLEPQQDKHVLIPHRPPRKQINMAESNVKRLPNKMLTGKPTNHSANGSQYVTINKQGHMWCKLCHISATSQISMDGHLNGSKHRNYVRQKRAEAVTHNKQKLLQPGDKNFNRLPRDHDITPTEGRNVYQINAATSARSPEHNRFQSEASKSGTQEWNAHMPYQQQNEKVDQEPSKAHTPTSPRQRYRDEDAKSGEYSRNEHGTVFSRLGSRDKASINGCLPPSFRTSQSELEPKKGGAYMNGAQFENPFPARASPSSPPLEQKRSLYPVHNAKEGNGLHLRKREVVPYSTQNAAEVAKLKRAPFSQYRARNYDASARRRKGKQMDTVETLKPISWDPFVGDYDVTKVGVQGERIPQDFLDASMSLSEWKELKRAVKEKGDDVDNLAFKIMVEMLLSPTVGVQEGALDGFNSAIKRMKNVHYYSRKTGAYMHSSCVPEKLWKRERRFLEGDQEWRTKQRSEDLALHLICENLHYMFGQGEDNTLPTRIYDPKELPFRGSMLGMRNMRTQLVSIDGSTTGTNNRMAGNPEAVENDQLFRQIYDFVNAISAEGKGHKTVSDKPKGHEDRQCSRVNCPEPAQNELRIAVKKRSRIRKKRKVKS
ncbi:unnamed protein product [Agarophyton chilense]